MCTASRPASHLCPSALVSSSEPKALETAHLVAERMHTSVQIVDACMSMIAAIPLLGSENLPAPWQPFFIALRACAGL